ncbi:Cof-type HAD-IIB family hydrolase [Camelimonas abortus]|uniref:Cof-type HAD-IIB family hydrolase n=1 Tax=Camelimonas abortus TaxID=1017184 RepID=A0ABV7LH34_9HYPH
MRPVRPVPQPLRWVVSDVDGTIVTSAKEVTPATRAAVKRLRAAGVGLTLASSRPPWGIRHVAAALDAPGPLIGFNGAVAADGDGRPLESRRIPREAAAAAIDLLARERTGAWLFTASRWLILDPQGPHVEHERRTIQTDPAVVPDFRPWLDGACKIVGVSDDHDRLAAVAARLAARLGAGAKVSMSQKYYVDVTPPGVSKGTAVEWTARVMGAPPAQIMAIGDMDNDVAMFRVAGYAVAMGNGSPAAKAAADAVTAGNDADGFAAAINAVLDQAGAS